ncbi:hypothetical protein [Streptacidiphilus rugosus]|uniref:hypothetical protein n=1 Tax=Streptacidiphilus rugosus TaxID=405783 RepID=UPI00055B5E63|nr:hypothetical protein [Streptacidiphilus rugosus]
MTTSEPRALPEPVESAPQRPLLLVDVDGPLNPYALLHRIDPAVGLRSEGFSLLEAWAAAVGTA